MRKIGAGTLGCALALAMLAGCAKDHGSGEHHRHHGKRTPTVGERIPILVSESAAEADKTIAAVPVTLPPAAPNDSWPQPGGSASKAMGQLALAANPARLWSAAIAPTSVRQRLGAPPVVANGKLFVVDTDAVVHAFAADSGNKLWSVALESGKRDRFARFGGGASFDDGRVFASDGLGEVVALNAADGKELWRAKPGAPLRGAPTIANGNVYVLSQDNQLFALDEATGKVGWTASGSLESQGVFGVAAPASSQGTVIAGFSSGELNAYRYENGRSLWQDALSRSSATNSVSSLADVDADPVIEDGRVYAVGQGGRMVAIDITTGQRVWEQNLAGIATPWLAGEWLFVVTDDAKLVCLARATGKARWIVQLQDFRKEKKKVDAVTWFGPVLAGGQLVLTNSLGQIVFRKPEDGSEARKPIEQKIGYALPPIVSNGVMYVLDQRGRVTAYR